MPPFRSSLLRLAASPSLSSRAATLRSRTPVPSFPVIPECPSPTCACADMPPDLDIDRSKDLSGTMAAYSQQLVVCTGQADWKSRIEDEKDTAPWGEFVAKVKSALGPKGQFHDPYRNIVVSTSSFQPPLSPPGGRHVRAMLFPSFTMIDRIDTKQEEIDNFIRSTLLQAEVGSKDGRVTPQDEDRDKFLKMEDLALRWAAQIRHISTPTILICSHNSRDSRCGVLGPLLHAEFSQYINRRNTLRNIPSDNLLEEQSLVRSFASHPRFRPDAVDRDGGIRHPINVGMISHVGGHKWAGNVIVYIPPDYYCAPIEQTRRGTNTGDSALPIAKSTNEGEILDSFTQNLSPLAGKGIWYGRVEPRHVEGIVEQTIGHGIVIRDLFRGGINQDGSMIRL